MKVALVHYWLVSMRGGEHFLEALSDLFPDADIFTLVCDRRQISEKLKRHKITTSFVDRIPGARKRYQSLLPLMPFAIESFDLTDYDLVISCESGPAKAVITRPDALHICYCHSPMRYIWDLYHDYRRNGGLLAKVAMPILGPFLRQWDVTTAARVDEFLANSSFVASRVKKYYRREATVIYGPVSIGRFSVSDKVGDHYLCAGQLVPYKRIDIAVRAFTRMNKKLVVVGEGGEMARLKSLAGPTITFTGRASDEELQRHFSSCKALIFPGQEDFGLVPLEVMAAGRPVIAYGKGGALETVVEGKTGLFFKEQTEQCLIDAVTRFEAESAKYEDPELLRDHASKFSHDIFRKNMEGFVSEKLAAMGIVWNGSESMQKKLQETEND